MKRLTWLEQPAYSLRVEWEVEEGEPETRDTPASNPTLEITECSLWLHQPASHPLGVGHQKVRLCDLLDINAVEDWDLWQVIEPKLWDIYSREEK